MQPLVVQFDKSTSWVSTYDVRPSKLFDGVEQRLAIYLSKLASKTVFFTTKYNRWNAEQRSSLFDGLMYVKDSPYLNDVITKNQSSLFFSIFNKVIQNSTQYTSRTGGFFAYFHNAPRYWIRATTFAPYFRNDKRGESLSTQIKMLNFSSSEESNFYICLLNSSLFYLWFVAHSDSRHLNLREISSYPIPKRLLDARKYSESVMRLMADYEKNKHRKSTRYASTGSVVYDEYFPKLSKLIIDDIDALLANYYSFTEEELDYIINYDIKYRMGIGGSDGDDE